VFVLHLTIFPNVARALHEGWSGSPQVWSIGVEEQFYLLWPLIISCIPNKRMIPFMLIFFVGYSLLPHAIDYCNNSFTQNASLSHFNYLFFHDTKFNSMCLGSLMGYMLAKQHSALQYLYNKYVIYVSLLLTIIVWGFNLQLGHFTDEIMSILFGIIILNFASNSHIPFNIENKVTQKLGKISYGIYMYHWIIAIFVFKYIDYQTFESPVIYNILIYALTIGITIGISYLSYNTYEKYFLTIKKRFEV
jgi:peptidoglycan/LPS O-acetylase OafA/YrhL